MSVTFYSPVIFVKDIQVSKKFYSEILNQEIEFDFGTNIIFKSKLSLWQVKAGHEISAITGSSSEGNTFELYFETEDIEESAERIISTGAKLLHDLKTESWGQRTIRFFDPDNHLVEIGETLRTFIMRIYKETGSVAETASKTGVDLETIKTVIQSSN
jgi:predicted enzyme related to lactoylglutathione lyase